MSEKTVIHIFHLSRKDRKPVFYHPFQGGRKFIEDVENSRIVGKYGEDPRVESVTLLRNDLYRKAEAAVNYWINDVRFIPRFLLSSLVFLVTYFFTTYVIRDPIPLVDELLLSVSAAVLTFVFLGRRYRNSDAVVERRLGLRTVIDGIAFTESEFMKSIEAVLAHYDEADLGELLKIYGTPEKLALDPSWEEEAKSLEAYLEAWFATKAVRDFERLLRKKVTLEADKPLERLRKLIAAKRIDFPLFLVYILLKRSV